MCGVLALLTPKEDAAEAIQYSEAMLVPLRQSRGPDAGALKEIILSENSPDRTLLFGHARLSIIDLSEGANQPMVDRQTGFALTFNGEIYNYKELRSQLRSSYEFQTQSDSEVLLAALQIWGIEKTLSQLKGMFAFVAYDPNTNNVFGARDRAGEKPLSYGKIGNDWVFTSDLRVLKRHPRWKPEVSLEKVSRYLDYRFVSHPDSLFEDFSKLPPGTYFSMSLDKVEAPKVKTYWNVWEEWSKPKNKISEQDFRESFEKVVKRLVLASDVPVGCFLSGGVDSSLVATLGAKFSDLNAYTIQFTEPGYDESYQAGLVAKHLGLKHIVLPFEYQDFKNSFNEMIEYLDEPVAVHSFYPLGALAKRAKQDVKVCLSGDGGDETFGGYNRYIFWQKSMAPLLKLPQSSRRMMGALLKYGGGALVSQILNLMSLPQSKDKVLKIQRALLSNDLKSFYVQLLKNQRHPLVGRFQSIDPTFSEADAMEAVEQLMAMDFSFYLPGDVLNKVDRATMAYGLEARAPFLDLDVLEMCYQIPLNQKIGPLGGKHILKKWLAELLPSSIKLGAKSGFTTPIQEWKGRLFSAEFTQVYQESGLARATGQEISVFQKASPDELFSIYSLSKWLIHHKIKVTH